LSASDFAQHHPVLIRQGGPAKMDDCNIHQLRRDLLRQRKRAYKFFKQNAEARRQWAGPPQRLERCGKRMSAD
jgi:hypothetical protein